MRLINKSQFILLVFLLLLIQNVVLYVRNDVALSVRTGVFLWPASLCEKGGIKDVVKTLKNNKITDVFVLVKGESGATFYPSDYTYSKYYFNLYQKEKLKEKKEKYFQYYKAFKDSLFLLKFVNAAHQNNIRVHAWFIVSADRHFIENYPGSEVVHLHDRKKTKFSYSLKNKKNVNLLYSGYKEYFLNQVKKALTIPFDGLMLDKIRYTHLAYTWDNINTSIASQRGVDLNKVLDLAYKTIYEPEDNKDKFVYAYRDNDKDVKQWIDIKKETIETYVKETEKIARERGVEFSAAFMPEGAYDPNFADVYYAQNYGELSKYLDFIVIMAYAKDFNKPATWLKMVVKNAEIRSSCKIWAAIQGYNEVSTKLVYDQVVNARIAQSDGIAFFRYSSFNKDDWNAFDKALEVNIKKQISKQIPGIIFTGGGTIRNCWLKSADAVLMSNEIIPLLLDEKYFQNDSFLQNADFVLLPGGGGTLEAKALGINGLQTIEKFVAAGGGYIGICAGAYLPIEGYSEFTKSLEIVNAKAVDVEHWNRGSGVVTLKIVKKHPVFKGLKDTLKLEYYSGPVLEPANLPLKPYKELAVFRTDIHENGAKASDMQDKTAILETVYKKGKIILFSPHPELTKGKEELLINAIISVSRRNKIHK